MSTKNFLDNQPDAKNLTGKDIVLTTKDVADLMNQNTLVNKSLKKISNIINELIDYTSNKASK